MNELQPSDDEPKSSLGDTVCRIADDVKTIAGDELQLAKRELGHGMKNAAADAAAIVLGGIVALIGLGMLCVTAVVALAPVIPALWVRMLMMAVLYLVAGSVVAGFYVRKLEGEARQTVQHLTRPLGIEGAHHAHR